MGQFSVTEVDQNGSTRSKQDVRWSEVTMEDATCVHVCQHPVQLLPINHELENVGYIVVGSPFSQRSLRESCDGDSFVGENQCG
jgi:hypothetical protein